MKTITTYLNKFLCITLSTTLLTSQIIFATATFPTIRTVENHGLPQDFQHCYAPQLSPVPLELTAAKTPIHTAITAAENMRWQTIQTDNPQASQILSRIFSYKYYCKFILSYYPQYFSNFGKYYHNYLCKELEKYKLLCIKENKFEEAYQTSAELLKQLKIGNQKYGFAADAKVLSRAETDAKVTANIWKILQRNPDITPEEAIFKEKANQAADDGENAGCNGDKKQAKGSPVYSVSPSTLNVFLQDIPFSYKPRIGPEVEIYLTYSNTRETEGSIGERWHINLDSSVTLCFPSLPNGEKLTNNFDEIIVTGVAENGREDYYYFHDKEYLGKEEGKDLYKLSYTRELSDNPPCSLFVKLLIENENYPIIHSAKNQINKNNTLFYNPDNSTNFLIAGKYDTAGNSVIYNRNYFNRITNIVDACGNATTIDYSGNYINTITGPENSQVIFEYCSSKLDYISDAAGFVSEFVYYGMNNFISHLTIDGNETVFSYDDCDEEQDGIFDEVTVTDPLGNEEIYQWSPGELRTQNKNFFWHKYERNGESIEDYYLCENENGDSVFKLNNTILLDTEATSRGEDVYRLKLTLQCEEDNPDGETLNNYILLLKRAFYQPFTIATPDGRQWKYNYDQNANLTSVTLPDNNVWRYEYTGHNKVKKIIAPDGNWLQKFSYNDKGQITKMQSLIEPGLELNIADKIDIGTLPDNLVLSDVPSLQNDNNEESEAVEEIDTGEIMMEVENNMKNIARNLSSDNVILPPLNPINLPELESPSIAPPTSRRRRIPEKITRKDDDRFRIPHDEEIQPLAKIATVYNATYSPNGEWQEITYTGKGKVRSEFDKCGRAIKVIRTADGEISYTTEYEYDGLGRVTNATYPDGSEVNIDMGLKGPELVTDRDDKFASIEYNSIFQKAKNILADGSEITFDYSGLRLTGITDAKGETIEFDYDGGRFTGMKYPGCNWQKFVYDWTANLISTTNESNQAINYSYDSASRLTNKVVNSQSTVNYFYNSTDHITKITDSVGTHKYYYDKKGQLTNDVFTANGDMALSYSMSYTYDNLGNRKTLTIAPEGEEPHTIEYEFDENNLALKSITDNKISPDEKTVQYSYDNFGRLQSTLYANDAKQEYFYNEEMRLRNLYINDGYGTEIDSYEYDYTPGGITKSINDEEFGYDILNQVTNDNKNNFTYDLNGNRTSFDNYNYGLDNRLELCDKNGETNVFTYDERGNRMTKCSTSVSLVNYTYDSFGRKVKKVDNSQKVAYYIYDGMDCVFEKTKFDPPNDWETQWIIRGLGVAPGVGNIVAIKTHRHEDYGQFIMNDIKTDYYHPNHRGDTVFTTDENGEKKAELRYDAFGKTTYASNAGRIKYRFSSKEWDSDAQLYYYGFRWYDTEHGIWTTKDPIGLAAGDLNVYRMVKNNPIKFVDQFGLFGVALFPEDSIHVLDPELQDIVINNKRCAESMCYKLLKLFVDIFTTVLGKFDNSGSGTIEGPELPKLNLDNSNNDTSNDTSAPDESSDDADNAVDSAIDDVLNS